MFEVEESRRRSEFAFPPKKRLFLSLLRFFSLRSASGSTLNDAFSFAGPPSGSPDGSWPGRREEEKGGRSQGRSEKREKRRETKKTASVSSSTFMPSFSLFLDVAPASGGPRTPRWTHRQRPRRVSRARPTGATRRPRT